MKPPLFMGRLPAIFKRLAASEKWQRFLFAVFSTLLILLFVKVPVERFFLEFQDAWFIHESDWGMYMAGDTDNDGNSERVYIYKAHDSKRLTIVTYDKNGSLIDAFPHINHDWTVSLVPEIIDINNDGLKEILFVSHNNDTVFLNALTLANGEKLIENLFIGEIENPVPQMAFTSRIQAFDDYDKDGQKELWFNFDAGYGLNPRGIYRLDADSLKLTKTPDSYIPCIKLIFSDINRDGLHEILPWNYAPSNVHFETEYSDKNAWITVFDLNLDYLFKPIAMPAGYGAVVTSPATFSDTLFFVLYASQSDESNTNQILLLDYKGNILNRQWFLKGDPAINANIIDIEDGRNYLYIDNIGKFELTQELSGLPQDKLKKQKDFKLYVPDKTWYIDADGDGFKERIFYDITASEFEITNFRKNAVTVLHIPLARLWVDNVYPFMADGQVDRLMVSTNSGFFFLRYSKNQYYWTKFLIWVVIFMATYVLVFMIQYFQRRQLQAKWATEKQLTELQFNTIRNQLNPHFIFNALNSVGYLIEMGKKEEAYDFLSVNTRLIRKVLVDAEMTARTLEEEIGFVKDYLAIQEFRYKERFRTLFSIAKTADLKMIVPKMVLHTYVENAVKHGFKNMVSGGLLEIGVKALARGVLLTVKDNGISKRADDNRIESTGKGLSIMESYYRLFEKQHKCRIQTTYTKPGDINQEETGMEVVVRIEYL